MWCPIEYYEFYDVPRLFVVEWYGRRIVFDCPFDEGLDDYPSQYAVYSSPRQLEGTPDRAWILGLLVNQKPDGQVPVKSVVFDESRRKMMCDDVLWAFYPKQEHS